MSPFQNAGAAIIAALTSNIFVSCYAAGTERLDAKMLTTGWIVIFIHDYVLFYIYKYFLNLKLHRIACQFFFFPTNAPEGK